MDDYQLALIYPLDADIEAELEALTPEFRSLFIGEKGHMTEIYFEGHRCLAKRVGAFVDFDALPFFEMNFISLLKKIFPKRTFSTRSIYLVPESTATEIKGT